MNAVPSVTAAGPGVPDLDPAPSAVSAQPSASVDPPPMTQAEYDTTILHDEPGAPYPPGGSHPFAGLTRDQIATPQPGPSSAIPIATYVNDAAALVKSGVFSSVLTKLDKTPVATGLVVALVVLATIAGAIVTITNPQTLAFHSYVSDLVGLVVGTGLLGIGRGIAKP